MKQISKTVLLSAVFTMNFIGQLRQTLKMAEKYPQPIKQSYLISYLGNILVPSIGIINWTDPNQYYCKIYDVLKFLRNKLHDILQNMTASALR